MYVCMYVKIQRLIMLDEELFTKLKDVENVSKLINDLLNNYFESKKNITPEEREREIERLEAQVEYEQKIESINAKYNK